MSEDTESTTSDRAASEGSGPGTLLRDARAARGMSIAELAAELRLGEAQVEALEAEDHAALPPAPFVRGYLRSSARVLGIEPDTLVAAYDETSDQPRDTRLVAPAHEEDRVAFPPKLALVVLLLLALGGAAAWWFWGDPPALVTTQEQGEDAVADVADTGVVDAAEEPAEESAEPPRETADAEPVQPATIEPPAVDPPDPSVEAPIIISPDLLVDDTDVDADPDQTARRDAEVEAMFEQIPVDVATVAPADMPTGEADTDEQVSADIGTGVDEMGDEADADAAADAETTADSATGATEPPAETAPHQLALRVEDESWIEVFDDRDRQLAYGLYAEEDRLVLQGWGPFRVFLGNAPAVTLEFDGESLDASAFVRTNNTARFRVGEDGVTAP